MDARKSKADPSTPPLAYSYQRFSSPAQCDGDSIRRQTDLRDAWLKRAGVHLDTSLTLRDEGKSAFAGKHRENPDRHALAAFLQLVERGRVPRGSYLIVESLDRLTREHIQPALLLFLNLLQAGVRVVQLIPVEQVFDDKSEAMQIMMAVMELTRGHGESAVKSQRLTAAWREKKKQARNGGVISKACPSWIEAVGDKYQLVERKAETVRRIYRLAIDGLGPRAIVRTLLADKVNPIGRGDWNISYVRRILCSPTAYGEYQPMTGNGANRRPDGKPIPGFYPAVVSRDQFDAAQGSRRTKAPGRPAKSGINVFSGLLTDATTGGKLHLATYRHGEQSYPAIVPLRGDNLSFPMKAFEQAILSRLKEIDPREVLPEDRSAERLLTLTGRLAEVQGQKAKLAAALLDNDDVTSLVSALRLVEADEQTLTRELAEARQAAATPASEAWGECKSLVDVLDDETSRMKLRSALRRIVAGMWCVFAGGRKGKYAGVQVRFVDSPMVRNYLIGYKPEHVGYGGRRPAQVTVKAAAWPEQGDELDFRNRKDARMVAAFLARLLNEESG